MQIVINIQRQINVASDNAQVVDISRRFTPGGLVFNLQRQVNVASDNVIPVDISRQFTPGGLIYNIQRQVNIASPNQVVADISRRFTPGGLIFNIQKQVNIASPNQIKVDTLRGINITLEKFSINSWLTRTTAQPPGIPWLNDEVTTAAWCWKLALVDGTILGFTSHDVDIVLSGITYMASSGFDPSSVDTSNDMSVDNLDLAGMLDNEIIKEDDLRQGRYDYARIEIFMCNYTNLKDVLFMIRKGYLGKVTYGKNGFSAEVRGLMEAYAQQSGKVCQKTCRATLGDSKCKVNLGAYTVAGSVTMINQDGTFKTTLNSPNSTFAYGVITWTSGLNIGIGYEVKESYLTGGAIDLFLPTVHNVQAGDTFTITYGCDRNATTCRSKFGNLINFRGELYTPGNQYVASYTNSKANNTVAAGANVQRGDYSWR